MRDLLTGVWVTGVIVFIVAVLPAIALGRPVRRPNWGPELLAGAVWSTLAIALIVPLLAYLRLLNALTIMLVPLTWPLALWLYRYRGAPLGEFRALSRRTTLTVLTCGSEWWAGRRRLNWTRSVSIAAAFASGAAALCWIAAGELRFASPADYDTLERTRALLAGGRWILDPAASLAAVVARLASVDPMQALRFLRPLTWLGSVVGRASGAASLNAAYGWTAVIAMVLLTANALRGIHRRDTWHVAAACAAAALAFSAAGPQAPDGGFVEYDAAARQTLDIQSRVAETNWLLVGLAEQRVELADPHHFVPLATFVDRFASRAGDRHFRFDLPARELFVLVETAPLPTVADAAVRPARYADRAPQYRLPNARFQLERRALELCERYRGTHDGVTIYYEDANLRIYRIRR